MNALEAISSNASRLLSDAKLLFSRERYPSALALAILALEESGKFNLLKWKGVDALTDTGRHHVSKQTVYGSFLIAEAFLDALTEKLPEAGYELKHQSELTPKQREWLENETSKRESMDEICRIMIEEAKTSGAFKEYEKIRKGEVNRLKMLGFYVDIDTKGKVVANPLDTNKIEAKRYIDIAQSMVEKLSLES